MKTILDTIVEQKQVEIKLLKQKFTLADFEQFPNFNRTCLSLSKSIQSKGFGILAEFKRKSPSAGELLPHGDCTKIGKQYEKAGAAGISCLTDNLFFGGTLVDLEQLRSTTTLPLLRKEFIIDELQIFEAKAFGADAILLIAELLSKEELLQFTIIAQSLGLEVLTELHHREELAKLNALSDMIGVNNRDLRLQKTDLSTSFELYPYLPKEKVLLSESGIRTQAEMEQLRITGYHGALIGESILRQENPAAYIQFLTTSSCV